MDSGVEFVVTDNPHASKLTVHILAAVAQHEREAIAQCTKDALAAAKARGQRLGNPELGALFRRIDILADAARLYFPDDGTNVSGERIGGLAILHAPLTAF